jgi:hypothetical protein
MSGTLSLTNYGPNFVETLFTVTTTDISDCDMNGEEFYSYDDVYAAHPSMTPIQSVILKQPNAYTESMDINFSYSGGVINKGCIVYIVDTGAASGGAHLQNEINVEVETSTSQPTSTNLTYGSEFCFGLDWGCQLASVDNTVTFAFIQEIPFTATLQALSGDVSASSMPGPPPLGIPPVGEWDVTYEWFTIPGGCGSYPIGHYLIDPVMEPDAIRLYGISLQSHDVNVVQTSIYQPIQFTQLNAGDCLITTMSRHGNGVLDSENQVSYVLSPL